MTLWFQRALSVSLGFQSRGSEKAAVGVKAGKMAAAKSWMSEWS